MTNEDVIDLYNRVKMGAIVVVLAPKQGDSPVSPPRMAAATRSARPELSLRGLGDGAGRGLGAVSLCRGDLTPHAGNQPCTRADGRGRGNGT